MVIFTIIMTDMNDRDALGTVGFSEFVCFVCLYLEEKRASLADSSPHVFWHYCFGCSWMESVFTLNYLKIRILFL